MGYENCESRTGLQYVLPTFKSVGVDDVVKMTDIKVTGWEKIPEYAEGWNGPAVTKINYLGYTMNDPNMFEDDTIDWLFVYDDPMMDGHMVAHWFDNQQFEYIENLEGGKYILKSGEGLWVDMPAPQYGEVISFTYAGEVMPYDNQYTLRDGLNNAGNPMPTPVRMDDVDVTGWEKIPEYAEGWNGPAVTKINYLGYTMNDPNMFEDDTIDWLFVYDDPMMDGHMVAHWFDNQQFEYIENLEGEKYTIKPGEGLWLDCPPAQYGEVIKLIFPSPLVDHTEK